MSTPARKIENESETPPARRRFRVQVSFDGLDRGEEFGQVGDDGGWADQRVHSGYLQELTEEEPDDKRTEGRAS